MPTLDESLPAPLRDELDRQYELKRPIGRGGMGVVWLARERALERLVAIKVLAGEAVERDDLRERFRREARIAARLVHPNIVPLYSFGETAAALYFVMGYVDGETLAARLQREGRIGRGAAVRILGEIADALAFAHAEGVVHRDVKPENILLDAKSGRALLADFGIARLGAGAASVTMTGMAVGTPSYMAPEQAMGMRDIDGRADVYALGVVGYRMLAGRLPFTSVSAQLLLSQHAVVRPDDLALIVDPESRALADVIMRALEKEPAVRWQSAVEIADELRAAVKRTRELPEQLERLDMVGTKLLMGTTVISGILYWSPLIIDHFTHEPEFWPVVAASLLMLPAIGALAAAPVARRFGWRETLRAMLHPPRSWSQWWPRALRRATDLWDRLPAPLRRARTVVGGVATWLVVDFVFGFPIVLQSGMVDWVLRYRYLGIVMFALPRLAAFGWIGVEIARVKRLLGLSTRDALELVALPNSPEHPAWSKPKFARLLAQEDQRDVKALPPQTPEDMAQVIVALNGRLRRAGFLADDESAVAAAAVRDAIGALESEVQQLRAELDPAEGDRIQRRLALLEAGDTELRALLENQRRLRDRLEQRCREHEARRDRLRDQLKTLWLQMVELETRVARGTPIDPEITGRVRALSRDLAHANDAMMEVERLTLSHQEPASTPA